MLTRIITTALFAGFITGIIAAVLQFGLIQPLLLHAELFENGTLTHFGDAGAGSKGHIAWPGFDRQRDLLSILFFAVTYTGYSFLLVAGISLATEQGHIITPRTGLIWGTAGFVTFHFAPAIGLPPEVPGAGAIDLTARQVWWFATAATTALGLWLLAFGKSPISWAIAVFAISMPHIIGAPQPNLLTGTAPPELAAHYSARALGVGLICWAILGLLAGFFWSKETDA